MSAGGIGTVGLKSIGAFVADEGINDGINEGNEGSCEGNEGNQEGNDDTNDINFRVMARVHLQYDCWHC